MHPAKLHFSEQEMAIVADATWILTKNNIITKITDILSRLQMQQKMLIEAINPDWPKEIRGTTPKISRGENYLGLPYVVLDYPRLFTRNHIFAIRSLFWWGKSVSTTLHLSGDYKEQFCAQILYALNLCQQNEFVIATGTEEWVHDVTAANNYTPVKKLPLLKMKKLLAERSFLKTALYCPVTQLNQAGTIWEKQFESIVALFA